MKKIEFLHKEKIRQNLNESQKFIKSEKKTLFKILFV